MNAILVVVSIAFGVARFIVPVSGKINKGDIYKDLAHIWVGVLIGVAVMCPSLWWLPAAMTLLEVVAFIARRK